MSKRTLDSFFTPSSKKIKGLDASSPSQSRATSRTQTTQQNITTHQDEHASAQSNQAPSHYDDHLTDTMHASYPHPIRNLPLSLAASLEELVFTASGKCITNQPHLDLLYFQPMMQATVANELFHFLRSNLPFYRVCYTINRFGKSTQINTPRFTTVFGLDETSKFETGSTKPPPAGSSTTTLQTKIVESTGPSKPVPASKYKCTPRPIPPCLALLLNITEALTEHTYNFCLVNYYASGSDSISYHSDDERFLGPLPAIASFTLGARRDFLMKHKPPEPNVSVADAEQIAGAEQLKLSLGSGDMLLMRGPTQSHWLHSIPKRKGGEADKGRINITLRKAMIPAGTENYYRYNVGDGGVYRWNDKKKQMVPWEGEEI